VSNNAWNRTAMDMAIQHRHCLQCRKRIFFL
jgi:hypothetical protein